MPGENKEKKDNNNEPMEPGDAPIEVPRILFGGRFRVQALLGSGGFGDVYRGIQESTKLPVAIKLEKITSRASFLFHEARVMQEIQKQPHDGPPPLALLKYFGQEGNYRMLIMNLMGPSLEDIHEKRRRFSLKTTLMLGIQMLHRLEFVHECGYVHRDLKPDNFLLGLGEHKNRIFLIDFGLSSRYRASDGSHREMQEGKNFIGTARYASARTHEGYSQSRRDDIEQLVYVMIYLYRGRLPWTGLQIQNRDEKEHKIGCMKHTLSYTEICRGCPHAFVLLLNYARKMNFDEQPAYHMMRGLMMKELSDRCHELDNVFDWDEEVKPPVAAPPDQHVAVTLRSDEERFMDGPQEMTSDANAIGIASGPLSQDITSLNGI